MRLFFIKQPYNNACACGALALVPIVFAIYATSAYNCVTVDWPCRNPPSPPAPGSVFRTFRALAVAGAWRKSTPRNLPTSELVH